MKSRLVIDVSFDFEGKRYNYFIPDEVLTKHPDLDFYNRYGHFYSVIFMFAKKSIAEARPYGNLKQVYINNIQKVPLTDLKTMDLKPISDILSYESFGSIVNDPVLIDFDKANNDKKKKENNKVQGGNTMKFGKMKMKGLDNVGMQEGLLGFSILDQKIAYKIGDQFLHYDGDQLTDVTDLVMELPMPAMVLPVKREDLNKGDVIFHNGELVFVTNVVSDSISVLKANGEYEKLGSVKNPLMGNIQFVEKVTNPFGDLDLGTGDSSGLFANPMAMMMLMGDDDNSSMKDMMMMSMMMNSLGK